MAGADPYVPDHASLVDLREAAQACKGCELYRHASHAVLGEGPAHSAIVMIGEQPGDKEDLAGKPFVGPAGEVLNRALEEAGIDRASVYLTNAVKHFKFEERGKRRLHKPPTAGETTACKPWLWAELARVKPRIIVCLGAIAARSVIGRQHKLLAQRGKFFEHPMAELVTATVHPAAILRAPGSEARHAQYAAFVADLKAVKRKLSRA